MHTLGETVLFSPALLQLRGVGQVAWVAECALLREYWYHRGQLRSTRFSTVSGRDAQARTGEIEGWQMVAHTVFSPFSATSTLACYPALVLGLKYQTDTRKLPRLPTPPIQSK